MGENNMGENNMGENNTIQDNTQDNTKPRFKPGSVVRLKSGGLPMVISRAGFYTPGEWFCYWMRHGGELGEAQFPEVVLEEVVYDNHV